MTNKTISPLRQRMIEDMTVRSFTAKTQSDYIRSVRNLAAFLGRSPDTATAEDLRRFQLHLSSGSHRVTGCGSGILEVDLGLQNKQGRQPRQPR